MENIKILWKGTLDVYNKDLLSQEFYSHYIFKWKIKNQKVKEDKEMKNFLSWSKEFLATEAHKNLQ